MAKKKTETEASKTSKTVAPKKAAAKVATPVNTGLVDTNLAAQSAAKQLVAGLKKVSPGTQGTTPQSKLFQQIKSGQTSSSIMGGVLDKGTANQHKSNVPFGQKNQKGHNQTFGADASKASVPRRTSTG